VALTAVGALPEAVAWALPAPEPFADSVVRPLAATRTAPPWPETLSTITATTPPGVPLAAPPIFASPPLTLAMAEPLPFWLAAPWPLPPAPVAVLLPALPPATLALGRLPSAVVVPAATLTLLMLRALMLVRLPLKRPPTRPDAVSVSLTARRGVQPLMQMPNQSGAKSAMLPHPQ